MGLERAGMKTIAFCEKDKFCQKVLKKHWPDVPVFEDIAKLKGEMIHETIDLICGGFPCQPFSVAGKRKGKEDVRHLWPEMLRIIQETNPSFVLGENVAGIINLELEQVCIDLESEGYEVQPFIIPACAVNAPHRRDRVWIIGYNDKYRNKRTKREIPERKKSESTGIVCLHNSPAFVANTRHIGQEKSELKTMGSEQLCGNDSNTTSKRCNHRTDNRQERHILQDENGNAKKSESARERRKCEVREIDTDATDTVNKGLQRDEQQRALGKGQRAPRSITECTWDENWIEVATSLCGMDARIPLELDFIGGLNEYYSNKKSKSEIRNIEWQVLRTMWKCRELAKTSPNLFAQRLYDIVPDMSYKETHGEWYLGKGIETDKLLCNLWERFYTKGQSSPQDLQSELLEYLRKIEQCKKKEKKQRSDRLKSLGNSVVPQIVEIIGRKILSIK